MSKIDREKYILTLLNQSIDEGSVEKKGEPVESELDMGKHKTADSKYVKLLKKTQQLEKVYKFQSSIIHNLSSGLIIVDSSGIVNFSNKAAQELLGYNHEEMQEKKLETFFADPEEAKNFIDLLTRLKKKFRNKEISLQKKDRSVILVGLTTTPLVDDYNQYEGFIIIFKDLTEVNRLKREIERMDRLALLGELSAGIAHEIRNPLAGIKAAAQLLEETFPENDDRINLLQRIVKEIDKSNRLLKEFFKFAKPSRPKYTFSDIELMVDGLFLLINSRLKKQGVSFNIEYDNNLPQIFADEAQIEQVMLNVLLNALDAMPSGGHLHVSVKARELTQFEMDNIAERAAGSREMRYVTVQIKDSGEGIPAENLAKIFDPFYTTKANGLGLGLSISSRLLEENLGKVEVESSNDGTIFTITVPCFHHN